MLILGLAVAFMVYALLVRTRVVHADWLLTSKLRGSPGRQPSHETDESSHQILESLPEKKVIRFLDWRRGINGQERDARASHLIKDLTRFPLMADPHYEQSVSIITVHVGVTGQQSWVKETSPSPLETAGLDVLRFSNTTDLFYHRHIPYGKVHSNNH